MAARPPTGTEEPGEPDVFGIAVVDELLSDANLSYPVTGTEVVAATDDPSVPCGPNASELALSTALERTDRQRFESRQQLLDELHDVFERERQTGGGLLEWLRSLVGA